jgi:GDP-mannose transporter
LIAYGEVIWFGGHVTGLTLCSFFLMVGSSIVAAWSDISNAMVAKTGGATIDPITGAELPLVGSAGSILANLNVGYLWMGCNCLFSAAYVLAMRKRIKVTGFKDWDSMFYNNLLCIPVLVLASIIVEDWGAENLQLNL